MVQVSTLLNASKLQDVTQNSKPGKELCIMQAGTQRLADDLAACKAQRDRLHEQLSIKSANIRHLSQENCKLLVEIKQLQAKGEQARSDQA